MRLMVFQVKKLRFKHTWAIFIKIIRISGALWNSKERLQANMEVGQLDLAEMVYLKYNRLLRIAINCKLKNLDFQRENISASRKKKITLHKV